MLAACDDDFTRPPLVLPPTVQVEPTITMEAFKEQFWGTMNAPAEVGFLNANMDSIIFKGRVCSSDETGNIYKNIIVQSTDENGEQIALTFSVNAYDLYEYAPFGQEVAVYATGMSIGGYHNLLQFGAVSGTTMSFMDEKLFQAHVIRTGMGLPEPEKVDTTECTVADVIAAKADELLLRKWQSRLVRVKDVSFVDAGQPFAGAQTTNRYVTDADGNRLNVRNSSYASFSDELLPYGTGSVTGILSYYNNDWQILLIDIAGLEGFSGENPGPVGPTPEVTPEGEGTAESPYNAAKALQLAKALGENDKIENVYVQGIIVGTPEIALDFGNATYKIADTEGAPTDNAFGVYRGYYFNGEKFTAADQLKAGDKVVIAGTIVNFKGNTPQLTTGNRLVSINGQGAPSPDPGTETSIYTSLSPDSQELPEGWTLENVSMGEGLSYVWSWKTYEGKGYLNGSAYAGGSAKASEAYAVSPVIDLTGANGCCLSFEHAAKFQTTLRELCTVCVRLEEATEWTALTIPVWPEAGSWTFAQSGAIDLSAYDGKKIRIAFKYASTTSGADTWEIKNLNVTGSK